MTTGAWAVRDGSRGYSQGPKWRCWGVEHEKLQEGTALAVPPVCHPPLLLLFSSFSLPLGLYRNRLTLDRSRRMDSPQGRGLALSKLSISEEGGD